MKRAISMLALVASFAVAGLSEVSSAYAEFGYSDEADVHIGGAYEGFFSITADHVAGETEIYLNTPQKMHVVVSAYGKGVRPSRVREGESAFLNYKWSCKHFGTIYNYVVTWEGPMGETITHAGDFHGASRWWCKGGRRTVEREADRESRGYEEERVREQEAKERREVRAVERYETNCRAIGGIVAYINTSKGERVVCHSRTGGVIPVPT